MPVNMGVSLGAGNRLRGLGPLGMEAKLEQLGNHAPEARPIAVDERLVRPKGAIGGAVGPPQIADMLRSCRVRHERHGEHPPAHPAERPVVRVLVEDSHISRLGLQGKAGHIGGRDTERSEIGIILSLAGDLQTVSVTCLV